MQYYYFTVFWSNKCSIDYIKKILPTPNFWKVLNINDLLIYNLSYLFYGLTSKQYLATLQYMRLWILSLI